MPLEFNGEVYSEPCWKRIISMYLTVILILLGFAITFQPFGLFEESPIIQQYKAVIVLAIVLFNFVFKFFLSKKRAF